MLTTIIKRDGKITNFDPERIKNAIAAAFREYAYQKAKAEGKNVPATSKTFPLDEKTEREVIEISELVVDRASKKKLTKVEEIESLVEDTIWSRGNKDVSKLYIGYRQLRKKIREEAQNKYRISVTGRNGEKVALDIGRLEEAIRAACDGIRDVSEKALLAEAENALYDGVKTDEITEAMIQAARGFIDREPNYSFVAGRLLLQKLADESLGELGFDYQGKELPVPYGDYFQAGIRRGVEEGLYNAELSKYDLAKLEKAIRPERDLNLQYLGLKILADRYFVRSRTSRARLELPQNFFMRVAMGLALKETHREDRAIEFYNVLSLQRGMSSTPTLFNSGLVHSQLSSCFVRGTQIVEESMGLKSIEDIKAGDKVLTDGGTYEAVMATRKLTRKGGVKIHVHGVMQARPLLMCTRDHMIKTLRDGSGGGTGEQKELWEEAGKVRPNDFVKVVCPSVEEEHVYCLSDYTGGKKNKVEVNNGRVGGGEGPKNEIRLSESFGRWLGHYLVSGHVTKTGVGLLLRREMSVHGTEREGDEEIIREVADLGEIVFGQESTRMNYLQGTSCLFIKNRHLGAFVEEEFGGEGGKKLPSAVMNGPKRVVLALLRGALEAVGESSSSGVFLRDGNENLLSQLFLLGLKAGFLPVLAEEQGGAEPCYSLRFEGADALALVEKFPLIRRDNLSPEICKEITGERVRLGNGAYYKVTKVEDYQNDQEVFDLQVENDHTFTVKGAVVHNCYLLTVPDSIEGIFKNYSDNARLSKWAGGIGNDWTAVRGHGAYIGGTNGDSQGGVPWWKITNGIAVAVNQGSKRKGAICNYLETWHIDIEDFLELRKETGDDRRRCHDMNTANWVPDLFMKRMIAGENWWLFSPDKTPELHSLYGKAFEDKYREYEKIAEAGDCFEITEELGLVKKGKQNHPLFPCKRVSAVALWKKMLASLFETGHPWITFKDAGNVRSPQDHAGVVHSSNLCTEIFLNTSASEVDNETGTITRLAETAVCNLASINIVNHLRDGKIDQGRLRQTVHTLMRMLDNVVDINYYPIPEARNANLKHRPVGLGIMGVHTALQTLGIPYDSQDAIDFSDVTQELISLYALEASCDLAREKGAYSSFKGSKWDRGIFPVDTLRLLGEERGTQYLSVDTSSQFPKEWEALKEKVKTHGLRNSNSMAIAPTACVTGDTLVLSSEGLLPIIELSPGTKTKGEKWEDLDIRVAQEKGTEEACWFYHNGVKPITKITTESGAVLKSTSNERIRVIDQAGCYVWKWMEEVEVGDIVVRRLGGYQKLMDKKPHVRLAQPPTSRRDKRDKAGIPRRLDEDWAEFIGLYMACGYTKSTRGNNEGVVITLNNENKVAARRLQAFAKEHGIPVSRGEVGPLRTPVFFASKRLANLLDANGIRKEAVNAEDGGPSSTVPVCVLKSNTSVARAFLRGLFEGGAGCLVKATRELNIEMVTESEKLAGQTKQLLEALGIMAALTVATSGGESYDRTAYSVKTLTEADDEEFLKTIGLMSPTATKAMREALASRGGAASKRGGLGTLNNARLIEDLLQAAEDGGIDSDEYVSLKSGICLDGGITAKGFKKMAEKYPQLMDSRLGEILAKGNLHFEKIEAIELLPAEETYDLSVPSTETYIANGFVCHNTIANICGVSEGIMPEKAPVYRKENLSGSFPLANPILIQQLKDLGLWEGGVLEKMKMSEGSIQTIEEIPEEIRKVFKTCFEIHPSYLIECASRRQKWIDQGQSLNLFANQPNGQFLSSMYKLAWLKGLKSTYYLKTVSASQKEKASVEVQKHGNTTGVKAGAVRKNYTAEEKTACSIQAMREGGTCEACE